MAQAEPPKNKEPFGTESKFDFLSGPLQFTEASYQILCWHPIALDGFIVPLDEKYGFLFANDPVNHEVTRLRMNESHNVAPAVQVRGFWRNGYHVAVSDERAHAQAAGFKSKWCSFGEHLLEEQHECAVGES